MACLEAFNVSVTYDCRGSLFRDCETKAMQIRSILLCVFIELKSYLGHHFQTVDSLARIGYELFKRTCLPNPLYWFTH